MMNQSGEENGEGVPVKRKRGRPKKTQQQSLSSAKRTSGRQKTAKAPSREKPRISVRNQELMAREEASEAGVKFLQGIGRWGGGNLEIVSKNI